MELSGRNISVIGLGKTGKAACRFLAGQGARVTATDEKPLSDLHDVETELRQGGGEIKLVPYNTEVLARCDLVVPSPGVPPANEIIVAALEKGIPILSELEIASRFLKPPMVAITGTNGKTTTTTLVGHILAESGKRVYVGGNIGSPLIDYVGGPQEDDFAVVEVSSFQLQWIERLRPYVAALLNVTCDHVDYHGFFAAYRAAKENLFAHQRGTDFAIVNWEDEGTPRLLKTLAARTICFSSLRTPEGARIFREEDRLVYDPPGGDREIYPLNMIKLPGRHNVENIMAALVMARLCGCSPVEVERAIETFRGLPYRIEWAGEVGGAVYYDDSKGTNVDAVLRALESFMPPVILLMGGRDKEGDFETLIPAIREKVKLLVLFGEARERIESRIGPIVETVMVPTLREGVQAAYRQTKPGDVVLLSPGCASFDEFQDYKDRGRAFKKAVRELDNA
ncbi:MAG: UDP-N-acetylmuramoylalanine--D-glutamate ligase [Syntrophus sp. SKADARSKE-3]|nr:UDP-N-acetylmuramoylalanine--D-glutamate ligase [Syntrophus sp. SKADARSKE-3]